MARSVANCAEALSSITICSHSQPLGAMTVPPDPNCGELYAVTIFIRQLLVSVREAGVIPNQWDTGVHAEGVSVS